MLIRGGAPPSTRPASTNPQVNRVRSLPPPVFPGLVAEYLAEQLGIADPSCVKRYPDRAMTAYEHAWQIRDAYGFVCPEQEGSLM
jgi:hypothetical protein